VLLERAYSPPDSAPLEFEFNGATNDLYMVGIRLYRSNALAYNALARRKVKFHLIFKMRNDSGEINELKELTEATVVSGRGTIDFYDMFPITFDARKGERYHVSFEVKGDSLFNQLEKEFFVERMVDYAAIPWLEFARDLSLAIFVLLAGLLSFLFGVRLLSSRLRQRPEGTGVRS
jgi:hypothetical protein